MAQSHFSFFSHNTKFKTGKFSKTALYEFSVQDVTPHQLFFLNFAQVWCGTARPEALRNGAKQIIKILEHSFKILVGFNSKAARKWLIFNSWSCASKVFRMT